VKAIADVHRGTDPGPGVYATAPAVMKEFVRFIRATETLDKGLINQVLSLIDHIFKEKTPMILRKRMCTLPPLWRFTRGTKRGISTRRKGGSCKRRVAVLKEALSVRNS
jgi:hypothetical protein